MKMDTIKYRKVRSNKKTINDSFLFLGMNMKKMMTAFLLYVIPFFIISSLASYYFTEGDITYKTAFFYITNFRSQKPVEFFTIILIFFSGIAMHNLIINKFLLLNEDSPENLQAKKPGFGKTILSDIKQHFPNVFFLCATLILLLIPFDSFVNWLLMQPRLSFDGDPENIIMKVLVPLIVVTGIVPVVSYMMLAGLFVALRDNTGIFPALTKVWGYTKPKLFRTWALTLTGFMITYIFNLVLKFPFLFLGFVIGSIISESLDVTLFITMGAATTFFKLFITGAFQIISIFHFTSLEEQKEGIGLKSIIENIS